MRGHSTADKLRVLEEFEKEKNQIAYPTQENILREGKRIGLVN
jgi:hypothetical protein